MSSFVQAKAGLSSSGSPVTVAFASNVTAGNLLVAFGSTGSGSVTVTDTAGNVWTAVGSAPEFRAYYCKVAASGPTSIQFALSVPTNSLQWGIGEWVPPANFVLDVSVFEDTSCTTGFRFTPAGAGELAALFAAAVSSSTAALSGTGVVSRVNTSGIEAVGDILSTASGSNLVSLGSTGCCGGSLYGMGLVFKSGTTAPRDPIGFGAEA